MQAQRSRLDPQQRALALQEFPAAAAVGMSVALWARYIPDAPALHSEQGSLNFAQLNARCNQLARALRARGLAAGDPVAIMCRNRPEFAEAFWGTRRSGLRITALNWHLTAEEAAYIVDDCDAKVFIVDAQFVAVAEYVRAHAPQLRVHVAVGASLPGYIEYEALIADQEGRDIADPQLGAPMLYTSGTTGRPKGVYRLVPPPIPNHPAITAGYVPGDSVHLCTGPLYHAAPLAYSLAVPHAFGAAIVLMDGWDTQLALELISSRRITHTHMVPTMFHRLLTFARAREYDLSSLQYILHGAAPCPRDIKAAMIEWLGPIVWEYYAATEGTGAYVDSKTWLTRPGTVGKPEAPDHIRVLDADGNALPAGRAGLIYMKSNEQTRFVYYKDAQKTAGAFRGDYFTLGDMGYLDADGFLFLTDRSAHLIISGGVNIYPAEIEAVLLTHPAVADVGVIGVPNAEWGEEVKAVVMLQPQRVASAELEDELLELCRSRLARFKCPRSIDFVDTLPRDDNGKLYKHELRERYRRKAS